MLSAAVITVSDRASAGEYEDRSGELICSMLKEAFPDIRLEKTVVPDESVSLMKALENGMDCDWIITTGGTGISPRDITPEITEAFCEKELPGISEILRSESYKETPRAMLSRGYAGIRGKTAVVNFPGSPKAVTLCTGILIPVMEHSGDMIKGKGHEHGQKQ